MNMKAAAKPSVIESDESSVDMDVDDKDSSEDDGEDDDNDDDDDKLFNRYFINYCVVMILYYLCLVTKKNR